MLEKLPYRQPLLTYENNNTNLLCFQESTEDLSFDRFVGLIFCFQNHNIKVILIDAETITL